MRLVRTIGDNVKDILQTQWLRSKDLADRLEVTPDRISKWLDSDNVELKTLFRFAKALEVTVERLVMDLDAEYAAWKATRPVNEELLERIPNLPPQDQALLLTFVQTLQRVTKPPAEPPTGTPAADPPE